MGIRGGLEGCNLLPFGPAYVSKSLKLQAKGPSALCALKVVA